MKNHIFNYFIIVLMLLSFQYQVTPGQSPMTNSSPAAAPTKNADIDLPAGVERRASVEGITEYRLTNNGLRVLLFPDQTKQTITVNVTYLVGSKHENYGETGMAHLLEHLVFKGSTKYPKPADEFAKRGAQTNGSTSVDWTNYFETFPASYDNLNWALDFESDRMVNAFIAKKDLDSEMTVVRNEFEARESSQYRTLIDKMLATAYQWHNYGNTPLGARSDIENVPIDRLEAFYKTYYQPDNATLVIAGKFDETKALELVNKYFSPIPKPPRFMAKIYTDEPSQDGERQVTIRRTGNTQFVMVGYHIPPGSHADIAAINVLARILIDEPSGRIYKALIQSKKASSVFGFNFLREEPGFGYFGVELGKDVSLDDARDLLVQTIENVAAKPLTAEETERAKTLLLKNIELTLNSSDVIGLELSEWIAQGDWRLFFVNRDRLRKVTPEDVLRVSNKYFIQSNRTIGLFIPTDKPKRAEITKVSGEEVAAMVKDYKGEAMVAVGEAFDPSPANIESRITRSKIGGVQVAFLTKANRGNSVFANIVLRFGDEKSLMNRGAAPGLTGQMLSRGTLSSTRQQIKNKFDRLKARVDVSGGATSANVSFETTRQNLPTVLRLVGEILREPAFLANEFDTLKQEVVTRLESMKADPTSITFNSLNQHFNIRQKGHPFYIGAIDEQIAETKAATLHDVKQFYKDFYGASDGQMTIVGDFDIKEIKDATTEIFGNWKSPRPYIRIQNKYRDIPAINQNLEVSDKPLAFFAARLNLKMRDDDPAFPALMLSNYILGEAKNSRISDRLRQREGLSYSAGSILDVSSLDESGSFTAFAIYAPENVKRLETVFREEIVRAVKNGFSAEEIAAAKQGYLQSRQVSRAQDRELANRLNSYLFLGRTIQWDAKLEKKIQALTPEQVNMAIRKYIAPDKISIFKAGNFAKPTSK
jgi:zinc protease